LVIDKSAWFPFINGRYACIGKQLALSELRVVVAKLVLEFDIDFAPGEDGTTLLEDSRDVFTVTCAKLNLTFTPRS
jgi:cytochrome P450